MTKNGVPMIDASSQNSGTSGTGTPEPWSARRTFCSRSIMCADASKGPLGFLRRTQRPRSVSMRKVGFDCPPLELAEDHSAIGPIERPESQRSQRGFVEAEVCRPDLGDVCR